MITSLDWDKAQVSLVQQAGRGVLYAVLDASDEPEVVLRAREQGEERYRCLFRPDLDGSAVISAPYAAKVAPEDLEWIQRRLYRKPWGFFLTGGVNLDVLFSHFRQLMTVQSPGGERWHFRFYDPRITTIFFQNCLPEEGLAYLGPISHLYLGEKESIQDIAREKLPAADRQLRLPLRIRLEMMQAFEGLVNTLMYQRIAARLEREYFAFIRFTRQARPLTELVAESDERARRLGVTSPPGVYRFSVLTLLTGGRFEDTPPIRDFLTTEPAQVEGRLDTLHQQVVASLRQGQLAQFVNSRPGS